MTDSQPLASGYGPSTAPGDNLLNDFVQGEAVSAIALARARGERTSRDPGRLAMADGASPLPFSNLAVLEQPPAGAIDALISEIREFFGRGTGGQCLLKSVFPLPDLRAHGCTLMGHPPLMLRDDRPLPPVPPGIEIIAVGDERTCRDYEAALVFGYPAPMLQPFQAGCFLPPPALDAAGWHHFVGYSGGRAVAAGSAYTDGAVLRVENIATMADARGRGFGAAITAAAIGADLSAPATLVASDLGRPVYERLGFRAIQRVTYWLVPR